MNKFQNIFGYKPHDYRSPLDKGNHPEVENSQELNKKGVKKYNTMPLAFN